MTIASMLKSYHQKICEFWWNSLTKGCIAFQNPGRHKPQNHFFSLLDESQLRSMHRQRDHTPDLARSAELKRFVATTAYINVGASKLVRMLTQRVHVPNN